MGKKPLFGERGLVPLIGRDWATPLVVGVRGDGGEIRINVRFPLAQGLIREREREEGRERDAKLCTK